MSAFEAFVVAALWSIGAGLTWLIDGRRMELGERLMCILFGPFGPIAAVLVPDRRIKTERQKT